MKVVSTAESLKLFSCTPRIGDMSLEDEIILMKQPDRVKLAIMRLVNNMEDELRALRNEIVSDEHPAYKLGWDACLAYLESPKLTPASA